VTSSVLVFVVEDEDIVLNVLEEALLDGGFTVAVARTGDEAMAMLDKEGTSYSTLITDIKLPGQFLGMGCRPPCP
jgi:CheY-like chemotaxis protein